MFALGGCANSAFDTMTEQANKMTGQSNTLMEIYQDPSYQAPDGTLRVPVIVSAVNTVEVETRSQYGQGIGGAFGTIGTIGGVIADQTIGKGAITTKEYTLMTTDRKSFIVSQPEGDNYEQDLEKGEQVLFLSTKPLNEGQNVLYISRN